ncbi:hypothetical protein H2200_002504 [Cladophialophora chaetospira]|uniref:Elongation factor 1 alpha-like protein n=1 Tax=Cladophialophora chaetospira TaxID=386627 RepID=A0AA38XJ85_9EURO|nr:hypothetical protein H2200_002504 [Cladophialophora chaetospira]
MSNRRVKSFAHEEDYDDYDDYDDEPNADNELSPEDEEQMRQGTIKVRAALGSAFPTTDKEIQEALWHYYYDVPKSVTYLKSKRPFDVFDYKQVLTSSDNQKPQPTTKRQPTEKKGKFNVMCSSLCVPPGRGGHDSLQSSPFRIDADQHQDFATIHASTTPFSAAEFFKDTPWLKIPEHRKAEIIIEPLHPRGRLLGGTSTTGKKSKLAALAAKRRQKENEPPPTESEPMTGIKSEENYVSRLKKLQINQSNESESASTPGKAPQSAKRKGPEEELDATEAAGNEAKRRSLDDISDASLVVDQCPRGRPSAFASIMTSRDTEDYSPPLIDLFSVNPYAAMTFNFAEPSPDDIVTKAQSAKAAPSTPAKPKQPAKLKSTLSNGTQELSIQDTPTIKSKNIDVLAEYNKVKRKNAANFVVIGHVDAGKSTLMGRLLFDLKAVDQRTMDKYRQEAERIGKGSFAFAWVLDQGTEERARGVTIDIATNKFETDKTSFTILDAPGHRDFVPNMIAGASQADFAVLVIDASTGNFESGLRGQTKEHALLARSIGVQRVVVAVNKMDMADWAEERFNEIRQQMAAFLSTAGFQSKNVSFVPCSGLEGGNILSRTTDTRAAWYTGPTLVEDLDNSEPTTHGLDKALRMTIGDVFRGGVQNPLSVSGRLDAGTIQVGEQVVIMPSGEKAQIRSLEVDDEPLDWAVAGQNVVLNLTDVDPIHLKSGDVLCSPSSPLRNITEFKAKILAFDHLTPMNVVVHKGRLQVAGRMSQLVGTLDKSTGAVTKKRPKIVQPGSVVRVVVQLDEAVPLEAPTRIVLRANGETVGAGLIE